MLADLLSIHSERCIVELIVQLSSYPKISRNKTYCGFQEDKDYCLIRRDSGDDSWQSALKNGVRYVGDT